jgi:nucleoid DNA-binding protein
VLTNNYKKKDLIKDLSNKTGFSLNYSTKLISDLIETIVNNIGMQSFKIKNIGTFRIINKKKKNRKKSKN